MLVESQILLVKPPFAFLESGLIPMLTESLWRFYHEDTMQNQILQDFKELLRDSGTLFEAKCVLLTLPEIAISCYFNRWTTGFVPALPTI